MGGDGSGDSSGGGGFFFQIQLNWGSFGILDALLILNIFYEKCSHSYVPITEKGYWQVTAAVNLPLNLKGCGFGAWKWKLKWEFIWCIGWIAPATNLNLSHNFFTGRHVKEKVPREN
ncbi:hypothetical protein C5167_048039 [Papaver somniferum]|uniref:Uncharacterized protein n=1 Tax=Papaver somniferum TaxID=3469 RepID=A0A4Y7KI72_PAPSO|nr:hypothetical protein C5167_048039 [Papaver somniferum]